MTSTYTLVEDSIKAKVGHKCVPLEIFFKGWIQSKERVQMSNNIVQLQMKGSTLPKQHLLDAVKNDINISHGYVN